MKKYLFILFIFLIIINVLIIGQEPYTLKIIDKNTNNEIDLKYRRNFSTSIQRGKEIENLKKLYIEKGFLGFSVDSVIDDSLSLSCFINTGDSYKWLILNTSHIDEGVLKKINFKQQRFENNVISIYALNTLKENILKYYENNGYPFSEVKLDSIRIDKNSIEASLVVDKQQLMLFDSIVMTAGNAEINKSFLMNYLGIEKSQIYNESQINDVDKKLKELAFINLKQSTSVDFSKDSYSLLIAINKKKASNFDGILGIMPDNISGQIVLTGDVKLKLINSFKAAEVLELNWKRLDKNSQRLIAGFDYPYIFSSNIGLVYALDILQKDTTYISVKQNGEIKYMFDGFDYISFNGYFLKSNLLSTANFNMLTALPDYADVSSFLVGMGMHKENFNFRLNPSRGYQIKMLISTGQRSLHKNSKIDEILYQGIDLKTNQYKYNLATQLFFNPIGNNVIRMAFNGGKLFSNNLFQNELYRLGGSQLLRGFDEESIRASMYSVLTFEYRYLLESMSYVSVFVDGAYYENISINNRIIDRPYGFGTGFSFSTKQGVFNISYALGKQFNNPFEFKSGKIHLGYISYF